MKNPRRWPSITLFVFMQIAWVVLVTLWVVWYVTRYAHFQKIGAWDIVVIVEVSVLLLLILIGIFVLFILYQRQLTLMRTQMHLISSITHEFKTPLATMQLYLETIKKRELSEETTDQLLTGMASENKRLKSLVENFLESARLSFKRKPYEFSVISVKEFIDTFIDKHEVMLEGVKVEKKIEDMNVSIDSDAIDLVFTNLTQNAIHYSTDDTHITIRGWKDTKWANIEFSDSGIGIPKDKRKDVFKMFQRLPEGIALWGAGSGMGLYVVKEIISAHKGKINAGNSFNRSGTSFLIRLPLVKT